MGVTFRILRLLAGLVLYGFADSLIIRAAIGVEPWTVLAQGVAERTGWGIGILTNVIGLGVLLLWIPLRQRPGLGTVLNVLLVGTTIEFGLWLVPPISTLWLQIVLFVAGLLLLALASGIYIGANLGPGPRDGLMTGIHTRLGWPIWLGRGLVEGSVLLVGWLLGGNVGIGTLVFAVTIGPLCALTLPLFAVRRLPAVSGSDEKAEDPGGHADDQHPRRIDEEVASEVAGRDVHPDRDEEVGHESGAGHRREVRQPDADQQARRRGELDRGRKPPVPTREAHVFEAASDERNGLDAQQGIDELDDREQHDGPHRIGQGGHRPSVPSHQQ
jgi:uncharacterized membrane protein YczE